MPKLKVNTSCPTCLIKNEYHHNNCMGNSHFCQRKTQKTPWKIFLLNIIAKNTRSNGSGSLQIRCSKPLSYGTPYHTNWDRDIRKFSPLPPPGTDEGHSTSSSSSYVNSVTLSMITWFLILFLHQNNLINQIQLI